MLRKQTFFIHLGEVFVEVNELFPDPRCRTFATIAIGVGTVGTLVGVGGTIASAVQGGPQYPNEAASSAQMAQTEAALLPL